MKNSFAANQTPPESGGFKRSSWLVIFFIIALLCLALLSLKWRLSEKIGQTVAPAPPAALKTNSTANTSGYTAAEQLKIEGANNTWNVFGAAKPRVTIVEFGDFTCPYCRASYPAIRSIGIKYQDKVKIIWRDRVPDERSLGLALAAHCAGEQGKFWVMHDKLYLLQSDVLGQALDDLLTIGAQIGLNQITFKKCLLDKKYLPLVKTNMQAGLDLEVNGTPTFFINGAKLEGTVTAAELETIIKPLF